MQGNIALEEHFILPSFEAYGADASGLDGTTKAHNYDPKYFADVQKRLGDVRLRLEDMDRCGIERIVLSLTQPGIQGIPDHAIAVDTAKRMNDGSGRASFGGTSEPICRLRCCRPPGRARGWWTSWSAPSRSSASRGR